MKTMIAIPCMDMVHTDFVRSLVGLQHRDETQVTFSQGSLIYDGRNALAETALAGGFDRILWLDSDMLFGPDLEEQLHADLDRGADMVSALYFTRKEPIRPTVYSYLGTDRGPDGVPMPRAESFLDYPKNTVFPIQGCGFGAVMMTAKLLRNVRDRFGLPFSPMQGFGEDFSFCLRVTELGEPIFCDSRIKAGHVGLYTYTEETFLQRPLRKVEL